MVRRAIATVRAYGDEIRLPPYGSPIGLQRPIVRHTGKTLAASTGASTKELMARMGHASPRAALIYQHATQDRDPVIAAELSRLVLRARGAGGPWT